MKKCENCQKGSMSASKHRHRPGVASFKFRQRAHRTKRVLKPNLHWSRIRINGKLKKMLLCAKCTRKLKKQQIKT